MMICSALLAFGSSRKRILPSMPRSAPFVLVGVHSLRWSKRCAGRGAGNSLRRPAEKRLKSFPKQFFELREIAALGNIVDRQVKMKFRAFLAVKDWPLAQCVSVANFVIHVWSFPREVRY